MNIQGVVRSESKYNHDDRGWLCEIYRKDLLPNIEARQVNVMKSVAGVMRGSHVHREHTDVFFPDSSPSELAVELARCGA